jgi:hypothetical protein
MLRSKADQAYTKANQASTKADQASTKADQATALATEPKPTKTIKSYFGNTKPKPGYQPKGLMISLDTL